MKYIAISILIGSIIIFLITIGINLLPQKILDKIELDSSITIVSEPLIGFEVNTTALTFGKLYAGNGMTRRVTILNDYQFPIRIKIKSNGNISPLLSYEQDSIIQPGEKKEILIYVYASLKQSIGEYNGKLTFFIYPA